MLGCINTGSLRRANKMTNTLKSAITHVAMPSWLC